MYKTYSNHVLCRCLIVCLALFSGVSRGQESKSAETIAFPSFQTKSNLDNPLLAVKKIQGTEVFCEDGLYLISLTGDLTRLFEQGNREAIDHPMIGEPWRFCSVFSFNGNATSPVAGHVTPDTAIGMVMGRNWDNQNVGSILITHYQPKTGYTSINFSRSVDVGFPLTMDLESIQGSELAERLWLTPFHSMDGINEHGLTVAVTGIRQVNVAPVEEKIQVFIPYLIRLLLDQTKTVEEAVRLVNGYVPFDLDATSLNSHLLVADASGRSAILEYSEGEWHIIPATRSWQVMTNKPVYQASDSLLCEKCWRYRELASQLVQTTGKIDATTGLSLLRDISQRGTTWSAFYSLDEKSIDFHIYQQWDTAFRVTFPDALSPDNN